MLSRLLLLARILLLAGLSLIEPLYHTMNHRIRHQDHEAHEELYHRPEQKRQAIHHA